MAPKNKKQKQDNKPQKGGQGRARSGVVTLPPIRKVMVPILEFPPAGSQPDSIFVRPIKKWCFANKVPVLTSNSSTPSGELSPGSIVTVLQQNIRVPGSESTWAEILYDGTTGWVNEIFLDEYIEDFPGDEVRIPHPTPAPHDAAQYMILDDMVMHNMCGELCVAYIVKKDIDRDSDIESVLKKWEQFPKKGSFSFTKKTILQGTTSNHLKDMLQAYGYAEPDGIKDLHSPVTEHKPLSPENLSIMLRTHYLIARVKCRVGSSGELVSIDQGSGRDERNHWIVVERLTPNGSRVEVYNPFHNKREAYSYHEFFFACTAPKLSGLWVARKNRQPHRSSIIRMRPRAPKFEVPLDTPKPPEFKAEQYMLIDGQKKTQLCGEFSVAYILAKSLGRAVLHWKQDPDAEIRDLLTVLRAYGYFKNDKPDNKSFSMEAVLNHWKDVQPRLYEHHVGKNQPTGTRELISILRAYGYTSAGDFVGFRAGLTDTPTGQYLPSPGRMKKLLKTHFLIAGVGIDGLTGRLIRGPKGVRHWVVVEKISPVGRHYLLRHFGGNGGWVTLYNPFTNVLEEYSYREFTDSMSESGLWDGLWVKRHVRPQLKPEAAMFPTIEVKGSRQGPKPGKKEGRKKWPHKKMLAEIQKRLRNGRPVDKIPALLSGGSGWSREEIRRLLPASRKVEVKAVDDIEGLVCEHLEVKSIPPEISTLLREESRGNLGMAQMLADMLHELGILVIGPDQVGRLKKFPVTPHVRQAAIERFLAGLSASQQMVMPGETQSARRVASAIRPVFAAQILTRLEEIRAREINRI